MNETNVTVNIPIDETQRLINLAQDRFEEAGMWTLKAATA
jgi:hypothetical protein